MSIDEQATRRALVTEFWENRRLGVVSGRGYHEVLARRLDRPRVLADDSCLDVGRALLVNAIMVFICNEDAQARTILEAGQFYLETAIQRDDLGIFADLDQAEHGRSMRLRDLALTRWLLSGRLDGGVLREASAHREDWSHRVFSHPQWKDAGYELGDWMAELILIGEAHKARDVADRYHYGRLLARHDNDSIEQTEVMACVADALATPSAPGLRTRAARDLDRFYEHFTNWGPEFAENEIPYDQKLIYAYVRGKYFKGVEDPIRLIKMMKFSE